MKTQNDQLIWQGQAYNARGQVTSYLRGTGLHTTKYYDDFGFPTNEYTWGQVDNTYAYNTYDFDEMKGNLMSRTDHLAGGGNGKTESFTYDVLNRLTHGTINSNTLQTVYSNNGNIVYRADIGTYTYNDAGPHAVTGLTNTTGNLLPVSNQTVDYTAFNKTSFISQGDYSYYITYGPDRQRSKTVLNQSPNENTILTKYYAFGDYEKEITEDGTRHLHYISGGDVLAAIYVKYDNAPEEMYFILKDHLGSITGAINSETGTVFRQNFDAWGRKRNPVTWTYSDIPDFPFDRGYTGHEHLKWFGLINMNGRLYDAAICRFISPDPYVQMPDYSQSFNRFSYCLNNPLKYVDPSGYLTQAQLDRIVNELSHSMFGGNWSSTNGLVFYTNSFQGLMTGIEYNYFHDSWDNTAAKNATTAFQTYFGSTGINIFDVQLSSNKSGIWVQFSGERSQLIAQSNEGAESMYGIYSSEEIISKFISWKYEDGDGYITYNEAYWNYRLGNGEIDLFADINKLDLSKIKASDFKGGVGSDMAFNFAGDYFTNMDQALVYGNLTLRLLSNNRVIAHSDVYDFNLMFNEGTFRRDVLTIAGHMYNGPGTPFNIHFYGIARIQP